MKVSIKWYLFPYLFFLQRSYFNIPTLSIYALFLVKGDLTNSKDANRSQLTRIEKLEKTLSELTNTKEEKEAEIVKFLEEIKILKEENKSISAESKISTEEATNAKESLKLKEAEVSKLKTLVDKDETELKVHMP